MRSTQRKPLRWNVSIVIATKEVLRLADDAIAWNPSQASAQPNAHYLDRPCYLRLPEGTAPAIARVRQERASLVLPSQKLAHQDRQHWARHAMHTMHGTA
ncbi:hypothetical protein VDGL01_01918 [Verticillium dahliae]